MKTYDPTWLVKLAKKQKPEADWFHEALTKCTEVVREETAYVGFISAERANLPGAEWQYDFSVELYCPDNGFLVVDVMKDKRIGGVEFVDNIPVE